MSDELLRNLADLRAALDALRSEAQALRAKLEEVREAAALAWLHASPHDNTPQARKALADLRALLDTHPKGDSTENTE